MAEKYVNIANIYMAESAANTLTFRQLQTGIAVFAKTAMLVHRIEYRVTPASLTQMANVADELRVALVTTTSLVDLITQAAGITDMMEWKTQISGAPATQVWYNEPIVHEFGNLPSKGLLMPGTSVYGAIKGVSMTNPCVAYMRLYFSYMEMKGDDYFELVQATQALVT